MIALALLALLTAQDTSSALSPRVRAMLDDFPPPGNGQPSIAVRFSSDTVWVGEQVELVTATWFPRALRDRLRHEPAIRAPSLSGLWSAHNQLFPVPVTSRIVNHQLYDLYVDYQTIFPLAPGEIDAPPAVLSYSVPVSSSYFAPEDRRTVTSRPARIVVRAIPSAVTATMGNGPTAEDVRLVWRGPAGPLTAGTPAVVELAVSGEGNLTLWPTPQIAWPSAAHVYPEPTIERNVPIRGLIAGEKRFRFTIVVDSAGVLTLPGVSYPYFDPGARYLRVAEARPLAMPVLMGAATDGAGGRAVLPLMPDSGVPVATALVRDWWPIVVVLALLPLAALIAARRRRAAPHAPVATSSSPEAELRAALGTPVAAGSEHVVAALRRRGIPRGDAEHVRRWLNASVRRRYGPEPGDALPPPQVVQRVIARLRSVILVVLLVMAHVLRAADDGVARYRGGDYAGAARAFAVSAERDPDGAALWGNLGMARWMAGDDVGASAAWLRALSLAPRDSQLRAAWRAAHPPSDVRAMAPTIPLSRDELLLLALLLWLAAWGAFYARRPTAIRILGVSCFLVTGLAAARWQGARSGQALVTVNAAPHISPLASTMEFEMLPPWTPVRIERRQDGWVLVTANLTIAGSLGAKQITGWLPATSVAAIGPLD
ncbi:MAG: tetratricopeptide repeat protein [Gemmatimonadales bacterium]